MTALIYVLILVGVIMLVVLGWMLIYLPQSSLNQGIQAIEIILGGAIVADAIEIVAIALSSFNHGGSSKTFD